MTFTKVKGYKVTDCNRIRRFGVACRSLEELIDKGCKKLNISSKQVTVHLHDGTIVDCEAYFKTLPSQSFFILRQANEYLPTGADLIYNALKSINVDVLRTGDLVKKFLNENMKEKLQLLCSSVVPNRLKEDKSESAPNGSKVVIIDRCKYSTREEDPEWFTGLETNAKTKEAFMFKRSQDRIRGYFYKTRLEINKLPVVLNNNKVISIIENIFNNFKLGLMKDRFFGCYLDRSHNEAMCDKYGEFKCGGVWREKGCLYNGLTRHLINPYSSKEERILFSTWNLDHGIERSRSIIPALVEASIQAVKADESFTVNTSYFYSLLFTSNNLRLVHVICHDKSKHDTATCDRDKYLIPVNGIIL